jgi:2-oxo-4-hydroxy-4-carboxy--5-ureidoimidazoline (OHCU) decarboxylase
MLASLCERLPNDADQELQIAAEEQRKITQLRLNKLAGKSLESRSGPQTRDEANL